MLRILIVDDEAHNRQALAELIRRLGHEVRSAVDGQEALEMLSHLSFDLILSDVRMPRMDGLELFDAVLATQASKFVAPPPFVFMTAYGRLDEAVSVMRRGALHFLSKPLRKKDIVMALDEVARLQEGRRRGQPQALDRESPSGAGAQNKDYGHDGEQPIYVSRAFAEVVALIDRVASTQASVLLVGESGTGKEVLARRLHEQSNRSGARFVAFHAGAMPETLIESELFGYEKGAFTGAESARLGQIRAADRGTFFIDELSSMPAGVQTKLLRVIQERTVTPLGSTRPVSCDVRWVAATNIDPDELLSTGQLRQDLLYRLKVVVVDIPPLRERTEDVDVLTDHFIGEFCSREGRIPIVVPHATRELLRAYAWPGNVRELRNVVERAIVLAGPDERELNPGLLPGHIGVATVAKEIRVTVGTSLQSAEDKLIEETLRSCEGDKTKAAAVLGVAPRTIYRWLERRIPAADKSKSS